jgi:hypothetical protein
MTVPEEKLHPDLVPYLQRDGIFHPVVYSLYHTTDRNEINKFYEYKLKKIEQSLKQKDFNTYVFLHERPHRIKAFIDIMEKLSDSDYWKLLALVYTDSENIWQHKSALSTLLGSPRPHSDAFMVDDERAVYAALPDTVTLYRGYNHRNARSFSYTLDYKQAYWFANRFGSVGKVKTITVSKSDILGYKDGRNEKEIVLRRIR